MKVSTRNIKLIKNRLERLYDDFNINPLDEYDDVKLGDDMIFIDYPEDSLDEGILVDEFLEYTGDLDNLIMESKSTVRMGHIRQTIVHIDNYRYDILVPDIIYEDDIILLKFVSNPILIGLVASREGFYSDDFNIPPCSIYTALEMRYKSSGRYSLEEEDSIIKSFLYHAEVKYDMSMYVGEFLQWCDITDEKVPESCSLNKESLIIYSEAMSYYSKALRIVDADIRFHHFYKIIEHFSPIVSKKVAYERLNQKLDALSVVSRDYYYLNSLLETAKQYQKSLADKDLCGTVLKECVDIVPIYKLLPLKVQNYIAKVCGFKIQELYKSSRIVLDSISKELGDIIYTTRNRIVHAKSNWELKGTVCEEEDMEEMNEFMKAIVQCLIVWNSRQPKEFRI